MINNITIKNIATFDKDGCEFRDFKKINFLYGANGSGKTTLSKVIANQDHYPGCSVAWAGRNRLQALVYNQDFINENFSPDHKLKGVFTLGETEKGTVEAIRAAKAELDVIKKEIQEEKGKLGDEDDTGGKVLELSKLENEFESQCWELKQKYDDDFQAAFKGFRSVKEKFKNKLVTECTKNTETPDSVQNLRREAKTIFAEDLAKEDPILLINYSDLIALENSEILTKKVIGQDDVDIAAMIKKLGNSDWVKTGREYFERNDGFCPFCQQKTAAAFAASLAEYFDKSYLTDIESIETLASNYDSISDTLLQQIDAILSAKPKFLDCTAIQAKKDVTDKGVTKNKQYLAEKKMEPSKIVTLSPLKDVLDEISEAITAANQKAEDYNALIDNQDEEKSDLSARIWRFLVAEFKPAFKRYDTKKGNLKNAIDLLKKGISEKEGQHKDKNKEIQDLEKQITSIQPTIDAINEFLSSSGFSGFLLAKSAKDGFYKITRPDGTDVKESLSEGEKTFITFLYFYHLLKGSTSENKTIKDRVVVFDDPVSSLDNDIMFIVSHLIKDVFNCETVKQVFVLTHNIYFHREVSFKVCHGKQIEHTFWIINKHNNCSKAESYPKNPIKTSYKLLWEELQELRKTRKYAATMPNTMRRIIEYYFKLVAGENVNIKELGDEFKGHEKLLFFSLISWLHSGSHLAYDDSCVPWDDDKADKYMKMFKNIFVKRGHSAHYNMMMKDSKDS